MEKNTFTAREFVDRHKPRTKNAARAAWFTYGIDMQKWIASDIAPILTASSMWERLIQKHELDGLRWVATRKDLYSPYAIKDLLRSMVNTTPLPDGRMVKDTEKRIELTHTLEVIHVTHNDDNQDIVWHNVKNFEQQCRMAVKHEMEKQGTPLFADMYHAMQDVNDAFLEAYRNMGNPFG